MTQREWIISAASLLLIALIGFGIYTHYQKAKRTIGEAYAQKADEMAKAHTRLAADSDANITNLQAQSKAQQKTVDQLTTERAALLKKLAAAKQGTPTVPPPGDGIVAPPDERDAVIAKDAELIDAQTKMIESQKLVIAQSDVSITQWRAAFQAEQKRATGLQIALDAQKALNKADKWIYRAQGFAIGIGGGYIAGHTR